MKGTVLEYLGLICLPPPRPPFSGSTAHDRTMGRIVDKIKAWPASAESFLAPVVKVLPASLRLRGLMVFSAVAVSGGMLYRWSKGEPLLGRGR